MGAQTQLSTKATPPCLKPASAVNKYTAMTFEVIGDAFLDTLKVFPFLLIIYILIEILEHRTSLTQNKNILQGSLAPLIGSATGIVPQCGFSVMAAKLYDKGFIRTGTLLAVFIATSDEALIIMLSELSSASWIMPLILIKLATAVGIGYLVNFLFSGEKLEEMRLTADTHINSCGADHSGKSDLQVFLLSPLYHALKVTLYLLIVNLVLSAVMEYAGDSIESAMLIGGAYWQPLITGLLGLIPNCASSVILTGSFINHGILFGSFVGGLCSNAGLGLVVLFKNTKKIKRNVLLVIALYIVAVVVGIAVNGAMDLMGVI